MISTHGRAGDDPRDLPTDNSTPVVAQVGTIEGDIGFSSPFLKDDAGAQKRPVG